MQKLFIAGLITLIASTSAIAADNTSTTTSATHVAGAPGNMTMNWFNPSSWMANAADGTPGQTMNINPMHPSTMMMFMRPQTHSQVHMAMLNPAQYAHFMQPQMMMQMMNPNTFMAWMNPNVFASMMTPEVMNHMMNPASAMHIANPQMYMQMMNPNAYAQFMNPAMYMQMMNPANMGTKVAVAPTQPSALPGNWYDPNAWTKMFQPQAPGAADKEQNNAKQ
jgi:hypothetical protein